MAFGPTHAGELWNKSFEMRWTKVNYSYKEQTGLIISNQKIEKRKKVIKQRLALL